MSTRSANIERVGLALAQVGLGMLLSGCPGPEEPAGPCRSGAGDPALTLSNRGGGPALGDGIEVPVFPPPQGGVFTELDIAIEDLAADDLDYLRILVDADSGDSLAFVQFLGQSIPLQCNDDGMLALEYAPVAFMDGLELADLDGVSATLTGVLVTTRGEFEVAHSIVLRSTDY